MALSSPTKLAYTIPEAVAASGISRSFLYKFIQNRELPVVKVGSRTLVRTEDLSRFLEERLA